MEGHIDTPDVKKSVHGVTETLKEKNGEDKKEETKEKEQINNNTTETAYQREWYLYLNNITQGPYNLQELLHFWKSNIISHMTFVYKIGEPNWKYFYSDETIKKYFLENKVNNINNNNPLAMHPTNNLTWTANGIDSTNNSQKEIEQIQWGQSTNEENLLNEKGNENEIKSIENEKEVEREKESVDPNESCALDSEKLRKREKKKRYLERKKRKIEEGLSDKKIKNCSVYITGLPKDVTKEEIHNVFKKAGIIKIDAESTEPKIKIYYDENKNVKGDALVTYVYKKSVDIAVKYFDNFYFRQECMIHVEKAQFNANSTSNKARDKDVTLTKEEQMLKRKKIMAAKYEQMRLQKWADDIYTGAKKKILIFRSVFSYEEAKKYDEGHSFYDSIKSLIEMAISKYTLAFKAYPIPKHPKGIVCVKCKKADEAEMLITCFNNTYINGNKIEVYFYDGKQDLKAQCLSPQKERYPDKEAMAENDLPTNEPSNFGDTQWESFHEWVENQSEDEDHKINIEG